MTVFLVAALSSLSCLLLYLAGETSMMKRQLAGLVFGLVILAVVAMIDYHYLSRWTLILYIGIVFLLVLVKFSPLGEDQTTGAYRWLNLGIVNLQVSELAKVVLIIVLAAYLEKHRREMNKWSVFLKGILIAAVPTLLIMIQTDLSSSMVMMFIFIAMFFAAGLSYKIILTTAGITIPGFLGLLWYVQQPYQSFLTKKQQERILGFLNPEKYAQTYMYQQLKSVNAISAGGTMGKLITQGTTGKRLYSGVYVHESDFIFSIIGEELGFIGSVIVIAMLSVIIFQCLKTARKAKDFLGSMMALGVSSMLMFQVFVNIGVATSLIPNTGLPLPFLSYGLSSLVAGMIAIGIVSNVGLQRAR